MASGWAVSAAILLEHGGGIHITRLAKMVMETGDTRLGLNNNTGEPFRTLRTQLTSNCPHTDWFSISGNWVTLVRPEDARQSQQVRDALTKLQRIPKPDLPNGKASLSRSELEREFTETLLVAYKAAGEEVGYWATRFKQAVDRNGGLATARRMLTPRNAGQRKGLDTLLGANRPDLTVEAAVLRPQFSGLFTKDELEIAKERLGDYGREARAIAGKRERLFPDELEPGRKYAEGARKTVRVNAYERNPKARKACIAHYKAVCAVCEFDFEARYGLLGKGFIHVHHIKPMALSSGEYKIDPIKDLRPVCPNCHAMLHRPEHVLSIAELKALLRKSN
jgi:5-methylcytosine-specific restriction enzyme A